MADNVTLPGTGTVVASDDIASVQYQRVKVVWGSDGAVNDTSSDPGKPLPATLYYGVAGSVAKSVDEAFTGSGDPGIPALALRSDTTAAKSGANLDWEPLQVKGGRLVIRGEGRFFSAAATTLTRPANVTAYAANDSISNNATAGSVTALSATVGDTNDDPLCITAVILDTTDTGLANGIQVRAYLYNSNPTSSTGVVGGDNAAFSNKKAGFIGALSGTMRVFSDGGKGRLVPEEGNYIIAPPGSGATTVWIQYQTLAAFTPSANSTTLIGTIEGFQGRA
jgi:hypothetical protein